MPRIYSPPMFECDLYMFVNIDGCTFVCLARHSKRDCASITFNTTTAAAAAAADTTHTNALFFNICIYIWRRKHKDYGLYRTSSPVVCCPSAFCNHLANI